MHLLLSDRPYPSIEAVQVAFPVLSLSRYEETEPAPQDRSQSCHPPLLLHGFSIQHQDLGRASMAAEGSQGRYPCTALYAAAGHQARLTGGILTKGHLASLDYRARLCTYRYDDEGTSRVCGGRAAVRTGVREGQRAGRAWRRREQPARWLHLQQVKACITRHLMLIGGQTCSLVL
jgi:hypothetical protein